MRRQRSLSPIRRPRSPSPRGRSRRRSISRSTRSYSSRSSYSSYTRSSISRGRSRSFSRSTRSSYSRSRSRDRPRFRGRPRSFSRSPRRRSFSPRSRSPRRRVYSRSPSPEKPPRYSLYISNLSYNVNKENLGEILEKYSKVKQIDLPVNNIKFQKSICAIVEFETAADADKARKTFDGSIIDGLTVKFQVLTRNHLDQLAETKRRPFSGRGRGRRGGYHGFRGRSRSPPRGRSRSPPRGRSTSRSPYRARSPYRSAPRGKPAFRR
ncbi:RNA-binding protein with serine-rich domain 1 [Boothiomyces sp. JEL0838]|nr:RNA-binding protein with serine-rich domain 1 [Boothiomyces sp. JEL0838]